MLQGVLLCLCVMAPMLLKELKQKKEAGDIYFALLREAESDKPAMRIISNDRWIQ